MKINNTYKFLFLGLIASFSSLAQEGGVVSLEINKSAAEFGVSEEVFADIINNVNTALNEYVQYGSLYDLKENSITEESTDAFLNLFKDKDSREVFMDYAEPLPSSDLVSAREYAYEISEYFFEAGFQFDITSAVLTEIKKTDYYYSVKVEVTKSLYNYLNGSTYQMEKFFGEGLGRRLLFEYDLDVENLEDISLYRVDYNGVFETISEPVSLLAIYGLGGSGLHSGATSQYWNDTHAPSNINTSGGFNFGAGIDFTTTALINKKDKAKKNLGLVVGAKFLSESFISEVSNFSLTPFDTPVSGNGSSTIYQREVSEVTVEEELTLSSIGLSAGISYVFTDVREERSKLFLMSFKATPLINLSSSSAIAGSGTYDARLYIKEPTTGDDGILSDFHLLGSNSIVDGTGLLDSDDAWSDFRAGEDKVISQEDYDTQIKSAGLRLELSPTYYLNFKDADPGWGLVFGLDIGYQLTSPFNHENVLKVDNESFRFSDEVRESVINQYYDNLNSFTFMFKIGLMQRYTPLSHTY